MQVRDLIYLLKTKADLENEIHFVLIRPGNEVLHIDTDDSTFDMVQQVEDDGICCIHIDYWKAQNIIEEDAFSRKLDSMSHDERGLLIERLKTYLPS